MLILPIASDGSEWNEYKDSAPKYIADRLDYGKARSAFPNIEELRYAAFRDLVF